MADKDECCKTGVLDHGEPTGTITKIAGLDVYVAEPANFSGRAVLFLSDIFGMQFLNNKLLSDDFAKLGNVRVYLPDFFHGDAPSHKMFEDPELRAKFDVNAFRAKHSDDVVFKDIHAFLDEVKQNQGVKKIAAIGYWYVVFEEIPAQNLCLHWGGRYTIKLGATDAVDAVATAHASRVDIPADIENLKKPSLWLFPETDNLFTPEVIEKTKAILETKKPQVSIYHHYPGTSHGFAVRGRTSDDKVVASAAADARAQSVKFFVDYL